MFLDESGWGSVDSTKDLSLDDVRGLLADSDGLVWAGTNGGGINRLRPRLFDTYSNNEAWDAQLLPPWWRIAPGRFGRAQTAAGYFATRTGDSLRFRMNSVRRETA